MDEAEMEVVSGRLAPSVGNLHGDGTASTMACVIEAMVSRCRGGTIPAVHADACGSRSERQTGGRAGEIGEPTPARPVTERACATR